MLIEDLRYITDKIGVPMSDKELTTVLDHIKFCNRDFYKLIRVDWNSTIHVKTLFHGVNGKRWMERYSWLTAENKTVTDGSPKTSTQYVSGFHVLPSYNECVEYSKLFKDTSDIYVARCSCRGLREKEHSRSNVWLANEIYITDILDLDL